MPPFIILAATVILVALCILDILFDGRNDE